MWTKNVLKFSKEELDLLLMMGKVINNNLESYSFVKVKTPVVKSRLSKLRKLPKNALKRIAARREHTDAINAIRDNRYSPEQYNEYEEYLVARYLLRLSR